MASIRIVLISAAALLAAAIQAHPQGSTRTINLTAEQRHIVKEFVKEQNVAKADTAVPTSVGEVLPANVVTHSFPDDLGQKVPQLKAHAFIVKGEQVIVVNPRDRTVQEVID
jgi:Protein of unknown function (DUF1236)